MLETAATTESGVGARRFSPLRRRRGLNLKGPEPIMAPAHLEVTGKDLLPGEGSVHKGGFALIASHPASFVAEAFYLETDRFTGDTRAAPASAH